MVPDSEKPETWKDALLSTRADIFEQLRHHTGQTKDFIQQAADSHLRTLDALEARMILWVAITLLIVLLPIAFFGIAAGAAIGAVALGLAVAGQIYSIRVIRRRRMNRLGRFRKRFRELLDPSPYVAVDNEDRMFLEGLAENVLFPSVTAYNGGRNRALRDDLKHIEMLYSEYRGVSVHGMHGPNHALECKLCDAARYVREHIDAALAAFESDTELKRKELATRIPGVSAEQVGELLFRAILEPVYTTDIWTFEQADQVRETCRRTKERFTGDWQLRQLSNRIFDNLSLKMKSAATTSRVEELWDWYDKRREWLYENDRTLKEIRKAIGRSNPTVMFTELEGKDSQTQWRIWSILSGLRPYGYDENLVKTYMTAARRFLHQERDEYERERNRDLRAARAFIMAVEYEKGAG
jgi:hypothetical protein